MANQSWSIDNLKDQLKAYKKKYYSNMLLKGSLISMGVLSSAYVIFVLVEYFLKTDNLTRGVLYYSFLSLTLYCLSYYVFWPLFKLINNNRFLSDNEASKQVGNFFPDIKDKLINTLQLSTFNSQQGTLIEASIIQKTKELSKFNFKEAVDTKRNRRYLKYIILPGLVIIGAFVINKSILSDGTSRIINYNNTTEDKAPFDFRLLNNSKSVFKGESYPVQLQFEKYEVDKAYIIVNGNKRLMAKGKNNTFTYNINYCENDFIIQFESAGYYSKSYNIKVLNRPELSNFSISLNYPRYLKKPSEVHENIGNITVPEGTTINWEIYTNYSDSVFARFKNPIDTIKAEKKENIFSFNKKTIKESTFYDIVLQNKYGNNKEKISYSINVIPDKYPGLKIKQFQDTLLYNYIMIGGNVFDDYGLTNLKIYYNIYDKTKKPRFKNYQVINIPVKANSTSQNFYQQLILDSLNLKVEDEVKYYIKVWDNDEINGFKSTKSTEYTFALPDKEKLEKDLDKSSQETENQIDNTLDKVKRTQEELKKIQDKLKTKKKLDWQDKKQLEELLKNRKELEKELEKLKENFELNKEKNERFKEQDEELNQKMEQLQKLMDDLLDEETKKLMEEMEKLMQDKLDEKELQKMLDKMENKDEVLEKEIERTLEMFKQMKFEQKLKENIDELKELSNKQKELNKELEENKKDKEELKNEQDQLNKEFEKFEEKMKDLDQINNELKNKHDLEDTKMEQKDIKQDMQNSSEQLQNNQQKKAGQNQKKAAQKMDELANKLEEMQQQDEMTQMQENLEDLRAILENLVTLSFDQEELQNDFKKVNQRDPRFVELSQTQLKLKDDAKIIEDSLYALAERVPEIESFVTKEVSEMKDRMENSVEALKERNKSKAAGHQQYAMTSINNLALMLDEVLKNIQQKMGQQQSGDQMCNKPGQGSKPKLGDLQKQLNQQIQQLKKGGMQGKQLSEELSKLAAQQELIRRALKEMEQKMKQQGQNPGDQISDLQKQMEETEEDLINKNLTNELIQRQQDIITRLLEAENSIREREKDNKRESQTGKENNNRTPPNFDAYIEQKKKQIELLKTIPPSLTPYYKDKVNEYFQNIEK